ncbi:MAG: HlyD family efflux transporter periplasmic adaptor subunit [Muribaculaceae bacterium]|nr:HlyD family efflux transporter periplasmic adaptor subunit [Muribaculaceae bacterium]
MDREITKKEKREIAFKKWIKIASIIIVIVIAFVVILSFIGEKMDESNLKISTADEGVIESCVIGTGKIVPLYEQTIISPVATRILEIYCNEGDYISSGQSLLRLDLQNAETDLRRKADEVSMKKNEIEQTALSSATYLTDLEMKIKAKEMAVNHLMEEVNNERRLDSIGSGTGDRIREAELAYSTGILELQQLKTQLANERKSHAASLRSKELEGSITERDLKEMERTIEDARVRAPRNGTVTYLNKGIGTSISQGEKLAVVSDLSHFKINGEIAESFVNRLAPGQKVNVRIGKETIHGHIASISPQSHAGVVDFIVLLDDDMSPLLRSGLKAELNIVYDLRDNVIRIPNGSYFSGPGTYNLFVKTEDKVLEKRSVLLGDSNFDYVEVKSGLRKGEEVVITDMSAYNNNIIHLK